eukprot:SAG11_NODE_533_length_8703_cov_7.183054_3_plen_251_part_00
MKSCPNDADHELSLKDGSVENIELYELLRQLGKCCEDRPITLRCLAPGALTPWWPASAQEGNEIRLPVNRLPHLVDELYERARWPESKSGRVDASNVLVVDGMDGKRYLLSEPSCEKILRELQDSHELVLSGLAAMDRDQTGTIEYSEFLGWWVKTTSNEAMMRGDAEIVCPPDEDDDGVVEDVDDEAPLSTTVAKVVGDLDNLHRTVSKLSSRFENIEMQIANISTQGATTSSQLTDLGRKLDLLLSNR